MSKQDDAIIAYLQIRGLDVAQSQVSGPLGALTWTLYTLIDAAGVAVDHGVGDAGLLTLYANYKNGKYGPAKP